MKEIRSEERIAFGNSLSEKRRESGLSQEELGQIIGKSSNAISRYENAENTMDVHTFAKTVNALKISPYELLLVVTGIGRTGEKSRSRISDF